MTTETTTDLSAAVIEEWRAGASPELIQYRHPTLALSEVYATISNYLQGASHDDRDDDHV